MNLVSLERLLNLMLDNAKISIFSKVDKLYLMLYWVKFILLRMNTSKNHDGEYDTVVTICDNNDSRKLAGHSTILDVLKNVHLDI